MRYENIDRIFGYTYNGSGNISKITDKTGTVSKDSTFVYDEANQLIRENNAYTNKTVTYTYDAGGNILAKTEYPFTTGSLDGLTGTVVNYTYGNTNWKDLLTEFNGQPITYDQIGNPLTYYNGTSFTWERGRKLATATTADGDNISYLYNDSGIRTRKIVNGVNTDYFLDGSRIVAEKTGNDVKWYYYDGDGTREAIEYKGNVYYYFYNAQGDVMGLYDNNLNVVVEYAYDSWGNTVSITGSLAETLGKDNPFRYRDYYYDTDTGLYYLNSRYYDSNTGRFINADGYVDTQTGLLSHNMYAYCNNNPVNMSDSTGTGPISILLAVGGILLVSAGVCLVRNYIKHVATGRDMEIPNGVDVANEAAGRKSETFGSVSKFNEFGNNTNNALNRRKKHAENVVNAAYAKSKSQKFIAKSIDTGYFKTDQIYSDYCSSLSDVMYQSVELYGPCNIRGKSWDMLTEYEQQRVTELTPDWDHKYFYCALNDGKVTAIDVAS